MAATNAHTSEAGPQVDKLPRNEDPANWAPYARDSALRPQRL